jgi:excisionase family DNA binding protein
MKHLKPYLTAKDVADLLMVSTNTIRLWADSGLLKSELTLGGHRRFLRSEVDRVLHKSSIAPGAEGTSGLVHGVQRVLNESSSFEPVQAKLTSRPALRFLIIEDEVDLAETMADGLRSAVQGIEVYLANDGFSGGLMASIHQPDFILLDLMMPGMNGVEVCKMIKSEPQTKKIRIIAYTGNLSTGLVDSVLREGAEDCLIKPVRISQLLKLI